MQFWVSLVSLWHELRVVLHNRENALLTKVVKAFAGEEQVFADTVSSNWVSLVNSVESMPYEWLFRIHLGPCWMCALTW